MAIDVVLGLINTEVAVKDYDTYVMNLKSLLTKSYELASSKSKSSQLHQKKHYDKRVLVKVVAWEGKHKIADRWEDEPYTVLKHSNPDIPVYVYREKISMVRNEHYIEISFSLLICYL